MVAIDLEQSQIEDYLADELTAEIDLSDPKYASRPDDLGVAPLSDQNEGTPMMCTPRSNSRVVRIISKQSNVWQPPSKWITLDFAFSVNVW